MDKISMQLNEGQDVKVYQKIVEGKRERIVAFVGKILKVRGIGINKMITVRQTLEGIDVEKIFPVGLPTIIKIELVEERKKSSRKIVSMNGQKMKILANKRKVN